MNQIICYSFTMMIQGVTISVWMCMH